MEFKTGRADSVTRFAPFEAIEVLHEFEGPRIFTIRDAEGDLNLAYWSDHDAEIDRYVVVPTSKRIVNDLRAGHLTVLAALDQPRCWLCDISQNQEVIGCQRVDFDDLPRESLPATDALLFPSL
jgi:hypothetical protein